MEIIDRRLAGFRFYGDGIWLECYLHEDSLSPKRFTIVEQHGPRFGTDFDLWETDDRAEADALYDAARRRTKARIVAAALHI